MFARHGVFHSRFGMPGTALADWTPVTRLRFTPNRGPGAIFEGTYAVKTGIHPDYVVTEVTCSCGNTFTTRSTAKSGHLHADVCSACHPFYTGKQKIMDVGGRVDKFEKRFGKRVRSGSSDSNS